jgi:hypothetical protein
MNDEGLFPEVALAILKQCKWNPEATMSYDGMSGGLLWSDEFPDAAFKACMDEDNYAFRYVLAYRASLIRQAPREPVLAAWEQLARECPEWPGLRSERCSPSLVDELESRESRFFADFDAIPD